MRFVVLSLVPCLALTFPLPSASDVATDGTVGPQAVVTGPNHQIPAELGTRRGKNLFHSFSEFSLDSAQDESATFLAPAEGRVRNVLARVTGPDASEIDGPIGLEIPGADLYFINPNGILFGPDAQLDVPGSFHASTADHIRLKGGQIFSASDPGSGRLVSAPPVAFGFLPGGAGAPIAVQPLNSQSEGLAVDGESVSLVAGSAGISIEHGRLAAPSGRINLASVAPGGEARLHDSAFGTSVAVKDGSLGGSILLDGASIDVSGDPGGTVLIRGGDFLVRDSKVRGDTTGAIDGARTAIDVRAADSLRIEFGTQMGADASGAGDAGNVLLTGSTIDLDANDAPIPLHPIPDEDLAEELAEEFSINVGSRTTGKMEDCDGSCGRAGDVTIEGQDVSIRSHAAVLFEDDEGAPIASKLQSITSGTGSAGDITIRGDRVDLSGGLLEDNAGSAAVETLTEEGSEGDGGRITIISHETLDISGVEDTGLISDANGSGAGGSVDVRAGKVTLSNDGEISADAEGEDCGSSDCGPGGSIRLRVASLTLTAGGAIQARARPRTSGDAGSVTVVATESVSITSKFDDQQKELETTGILASTRGEGDAGRIVVRAPTVTLAEFGLIAANTIGAKVRANDSTGAAIQEGDAGSITVKTKELTLTGGARIESQSKQSDQDPNDVSDGNGGEVKIVADRMISVHEIGTFTDEDGDTTQIPSAIAVGTKGNGQGGDAKITAKHIELGDGGTISSTSSGTGDAGRIRIVSSESLSLEGTEITSEAPSASGGEIGIRAGGLSLVDSEIRTKAAGTGGDVSIEAGSVSLDSDSRVVTQGDESGGDVDVVFLFGEAPSNSQIDAVGEVKSGSIDVSSPELNIAGTLARLPGAFLDVKPLVRCASADAGTGSSFTDRLGGSQAGPDAYLPSDLHEESDRAQGPSASAEAVLSDSSFGPRMCAR